MNKSEVLEMLALIETDPELKTKFVEILGSLIENDFTIQQKITDMVGRDLGRKMRSIG